MVGRESSLLSAKPRRSQPAVRRWKTDFGRSQLYNCCTHEKPPLRCRNGGFRLLNLQLTCASVKLESVANASLERRNFVSDDRSRCRLNFGGFVANIQGCALRHVVHGKQSQAI
jgi:hypothetical protein